jgi:hypothetical protein
MSWWRSLLPCYFKNFELSINYKADLKKRCFNKGLLSVALTLGVVPLLFWSAHGAIKVIISAKLSLKKNMTVV